LFDAGTYSEYLTFTRDVAIRGAGADATFLMAVRPRSAGRASSIGHRPSSIVDRRIVHRRIGQRSSAGADRQP
jgi:hypothetical protein